MANYLKVSIIVIAMIVAWAGCSNGNISLGKEIPADAELVELADLLKEPGKWNGKKILLKGNVSSQCASLCDFNLKNGSSVVTIFPDGYSLPKLNIGRNAEVYAEITAGDERVVVSALGIKIE